jgi:hypothetical protein
MKISLDELEENCPGSVKVLLKGERTFLGSFSKNGTYYSFHLLHRLGNKFLVYQSKMDLVESKTRLVGVVRPGMPAKLNTFATVKGSRIDSMFWDDDGAPIFKGYYNNLPGEWRALHVKSNFEEKEDNDSSEEFETKLVYQFTEKSSGQVWLLSEDNLNVPTEILYIYLKKQTNG